ncbi:MAG: menaquinone biosynthesis decarboxylase [Anaerolineaceae bacterium]
MGYKDLRSFIEFLEGKDQLRRVLEPVSPDLEMTEVTDRVSKGPAGKNKALLFEKPAGYDIPVLMNAFGSHDRMAWALGVNRLEDLNERLAALLDLRMPSGLGGALSRGGGLLGALMAAGVKPHKVRTAPVQEVIEKEHPSIDFLPILKCWPKDGGKFITLPQVITKNPATGARNVGMYRLQVLDGQTLLVHWQRHKGGAEHEKQALEKNLDSIPAAIVLGGDPASMWCASAPLPPEIDEYLLAGYLNGSAVPFVDCVSQQLSVPANAEIVVEGYVDPHDHRPEGPFGDHTGYYTPVELFPVFHVTAVTQRRNPIYPATVVGIPPMEDAWMGKATERLFLPLVRLFMPEIRDICMPAEGVFHNLVLVSLKKQYPGHARKVISGLWGLGLLLLAKAIVVVDEWVDVQDLSRSSWQALGNVDWSRDIVVMNGAVDQLDHASYASTFGGKIGVDATAKWPEEGYGRAWPEAVSMQPDVRQKIDQIWNELGL